MMRWGAQTESMYKFGHLPGLTTRAIVWYWLSYVNQRSDCEHMYCQPILAESLEGVAPAVVLVGESDVLRDEGVEYAKRLNESGVDLTYLRMQGTHFGVLISSKARAAVAAALQKMFSQ